MKRSLLFLLVACIATPLFPATGSDCGPATHLASLYQLRSIMLRPYSSSDDARRFMDQRIEELRGPMPDGGYRWVRWVRPSGSGPVDKKVHSANAIYGNGDDRFETTGEHAFSVRVVVPSKRSTFKGNNPVYVGDVTIEYGRKTDVMHINRWMQPDTSQTFDLPGGVIYDNVRVTVPSAVDKRDVREAVVEVHFKQGVPQDDPANPAYSAIKALDRIRTTPDAATVDAEIAALEESVFPGTDSLPLVTLVRDLRRADELLRSDKQEDKDKGDRLLKDTMRRLR
jgi:hypothetical protein